MFGLTFVYSTSADPLTSVELNNGHFRVDYLGINPSYLDQPEAPVRTVRYAVTSLPCSAQANLVSPLPTTGKGRGKGGGGGPKEPKCAGMSHFSIGFEPEHSLKENDLLAPKECLDLCYGYTTMCDYEPELPYDCIPGKFKPSYGWSGATKFPGLKFSKDLNEPSLPIGKTFIFHITYQDNGRYKEGCVDVLVKPGNQSYWGPLLGPILVNPDTTESPCAPNPKPN